MSRRICVDLYNELAKLRPEWAAEDDDAGAMKIIMTGSASDPEGWQEHIRNKDRRERLADRFKNPDDPFRVVIVRDMWLTGFDAPSRVNVTLPARSDSVATVGGVGFGGGCGGSSSGQAVNSAHNATAASLLTSRPRAARVSAP